MRTHPSSFLLLAFSLTAACVPGTVTSSMEGSSAQLGSGEVVLDDASDAGVGQTTLSGEVAVLGLPSAGGVTLTLTPGGQGAVSDPTGAFFFPSIAAGNLTLTATLAGFCSVSVPISVVSGDAPIVELTLERSCLRLASLSDAGLFLSRGSAGDGGALPVFFGNGGGVYRLDADGGIGLAFASDGGLRLLGLDASGSPVLETTDSDGVTPLVTFLAAPGALQRRLSGLELPELVGSAVYARTGNNWYAIDAADLAPAQVSSEIALWPPPVALSYGLAGWSVHTPLHFGPQLSQPLWNTALVPTQLTPSRDGDRLAFVALSPQGGSSQVVIVGSSGPRIFGAWSGWSGAVGAVYPVSDDTYALAQPDPAGWLNVSVVSADGGTTVPALGWAPLHGEGLLAATLLDGGSATLTAIGSTVQGGVPFPYAWSAPLLSPSNRYAIFPGVASIFDLARKIEAPLGLTPVTVAFDPQEAHALLLDAAGNQSVVGLANLSATAPQDVPLEGFAIVDAFGPNGSTVVYAGTDPENNLGLFEQPLP